MLYFALIWYVSESVLQPIPVYSIGMVLKSLSETSFQSPPKASRPMPLDVCIVSLSKLLFLSYNISVLPLLSFTICSANFTSNKSSDTTQFCWCELPSITLIMDCLGDFVFIVFFIISFNFIN